MNSTTTDSEPESRAEASVVYAGFLRRAAAGLVDFAVLLPVIYLGAWVDQRSWLVVLLALVPLMAVQLGYVIAFHARWGQTIGKMAAGIQLKQLSGSTVTWRQACLRSSIDIAFVLLFVCGIIFSMAVIGPTEFNLLSIEQRQERLLQASPIPLGFINLGQIAWAFSELLVLLLNKKRRAIHDFLAGTVVVQVNDTRSQRLQKLLLWPSAIAICAVIFLPIALPNYLASQHAEDLNRIHNNLRMIEGAKEQWALENNGRPGATPVAQEIAVYLKGGQLPEPVAGEVYQINAIGTVPSARLKDSARTVITSAPVR